jgi:NAD(P)-dependent dehydrogenase (short-subunit alcohol dehydrogenase family)
MKLMNRIALVTGGAHRVGRAICMALTAEGADIALHYGASEDAARGTAEEIQSLGRRVVLLQADLSSWSASRELGVRALEAFGRIDILVNNASTFVRGQFAATSESDFDRAFDVNIKAPYALCQVIGASMAARKAGDPGAIINIVDEGALSPSRDFAAHGLSKAALLALTRLLAVELGPAVRTNAICPGPILKPARMSEARWQALREGNPMQALGSAEDLAACVVFLASGPAFINGECLMLDGGRNWTRR